MVRFGRHLETSSRMSSRTASRCIYCGAQCAFAKTWSLARWAFWQPWARTTSSTRSASGWKQQEVRSLSWSLLLSALLRHCLSKGRKPGRCSSEMMPSASAVHSAASGPWHHGYCPWGMYPLCWSMCIFCASSASKFHNATFDAPQC